MEKKDGETDGGGDGVGGRKRRRVQAARVAVETGYWGIEWQVYLERRQRDGLTATSHEILLQQGTDRHITPTHTHHISLLSAHKRKT